ncbi:MAG: caspase family protein, partial [Ignavibacteriales bacterium]|nr:caspase family protein [Ignavibacteriales bacterium]
DRYEYREVFDISDFIDKITYNPNKEVEKKIIKTKEITKKHDTEKPSLTIISPLINKGIIRTEESFITISGNATDKEGIAFVTINDKNAQLKSNGDFLSRIKLKIGKNTITVKAVDINDNETTKEFVVIREEFTQESEFSDVDFAPERKNKNENGIAVVFGIEEYQYAPKVTYAYSDADIFREYLVKSFGFKRENIYFRTSERATKGEFDKVFSLNGWLAKQATSKSDVVIFYAGHGAPEIKSESAYLIPYDIDPNYSSTGYALQELYDNLGKIQAKSITVFLDACFSGGTRDNQSLLSEARPVHLKIKGSIVPDNTIVFSASANNEISSGYSQKLHGLFSYFVLKGFNGYADVNKDEKITVEELQNYLSENVSTQAKKMGREQNPQLLGKERNRVLLKY